MDKNRPDPEPLVQLGAASEQTLGAAGDYTDFVRFMEKWGIALD